MTMIEICNVLDAENINKFDFETFAEICKWIGKNCHTIVEVKRYDDYGWANVSFMTGHFGGTYCNFHFDLKTRRVVDWFGSNHETEIRTWDELAQHIGKEKKKEESQRDLDALAEFINSQNED